jgi:GNAT superfamily N-acetyltransferase
MKLNPSPCPPQTPFADVELAERIEATAAAEIRRFVRTAQLMDHGTSATGFDVAGGAAAFLAPDSPMNRAIGLGMTGPVDESDIIGLARFFADHEATPSIGVCPLAHPTLVEHLSAEGWIVEGFENVLVRALGAEDAVESRPANGIEIREVADDRDRELWKLVAATGFSWPLPPLDSQFEIGEVVVRRPGTRLYLAFCEERAAGVAELMIDGATAWLSADTTLAQFRGRGVQRALQERRLAVAAGNGCDLAVSEATPGSISQRNMERAGFRVVYTRLDMTHPDVVPTRE